MINTLKKQFQGVWLKMAFNRLVKTLKNDKKQMNAAEVIDFLFSREGSLICPWQFKSEIRGFLTAYEGLKPKYAMEIGTANGGTLFGHCRIADPSATIISVDLPGGKFGGGYPDWKTRIYSEFALPKQSLHLVRASSHEATTVEKVKQLLANNQLDYLFIDGDHTYEGVKKDFLLYSPFVKKGGIIVFHDIVPHPGSACRVDEFWNEVKQNYEFKEFIDDPKQTCYGVGLIFNNKS